MFNIFYFFSFINFDKIVLSGYNINNKINIKNAISPNDITEGNYKKFIKTSNIFKYNEKFSIIDNINITYKNPIIYEISDSNENHNNYMLLKNDNTNNYLNNRSFNEILKNEIKFLQNNNTKIYIHIEEIFNDLNIYHIGVTFKNVFSKVRYDIVGLSIYEIDIFKNNKNKRSKTIFWDYSNKSLSEIIEYERTMEYKYILGIYDCRHYVRNITTWASNKPTPVWRLGELMN